MNSCYIHTHKLGHMCISRPPISEDIGCLVYIRLGIISLCVKCTLYTIHYTLYTIQYTLYTVHCTLYTIHYTLFTIHHTLYTIHYTLYTIHYTLYKTMCNEHKTQCTTYVIMIRKVLYMRITFNNFSSSMDYL